jgi:hypothetical protein
MFRASPLLAGLYCAFNHQQQAPAFCMSAEEEAMMLQKMMHEQGIQDPEEM